MLRRSCDWLLCGGSHGVHYVGACELNQGELILVGWKYLECSGYYYVPFYDAAASLIAPWQIAFGTAVYGTFDTQGQNMCKLYVVMHWLTVIVMSVMIAGVLRHVGSRVGCLL